MKRNAIGHMSASAVPVRPRLAALHLPARLLCLLLALVIWLMVYDESRNTPHESDEDGTTVQETV